MTGRPGGAGPHVHPTRDDRVVAWASDGVGGPMGSRARPHRWWTPVRVLLALVAVVFAVGMLQKTPCYVDTWQDGEQRYALMCYSDLPYLYTGRGLAELAWPYTGEDRVREDYEVMEYPVGISYAAWAAAWLTQGVGVLAGDAVDIEARRAAPAEDLPGKATVQRDTRRYVAVTAVLLGIAALVSVWFLARVNPGRPWDAAGFAAAPVLALTALVNWDLFAVGFVAGALWAWARARPVAAGVLIGVGTAVKLYPLFLLGGILVLCLRRRELRDVAAATGAAVLAWAVVNLPALLTGAEQWLVFWRFNAERGADLGSLWLVVEQAGNLDFTADTINRWSWLLFGLWCAGVLAVGLLARRPPRLAQLGLLVVAGFLLVNKVYSPQYVLWLLPLAALARPRWRDLLIWQAGEVFYFAAVWWYLGGFLEPPGGGDVAVYWLAIVLRVLAQLYLVAVVTRDVLRPESDPVEREAGSDALVAPPIR